MHTRNIFLTTLLGLLLYIATPHCTAQTTPDPGIAGTYAVTKAQYDLGDLAATLTSFPDPVEVRGSIHYPTSLTGGPFPVIVLLHGRHSTCYRLSDNATSLTWPCPTGYAPITSYEGYDYQARFLASHGYVVVSISCNAINATDQSYTDRGMPGRGELVQYHLNLLNTWNTTGAAPFGSLFVGKLDMQRIGTMGHSRGGEGVIYNALLNRSLGSPYGIKAVITLAPVDFFRKVLNGIPMMNIAPYCDGDVSTLSGVHFYDDARYTDTADETPKFNLLMMGANHNFYNTVWTPGSYIAGGSDDWGATSSNPYCGATVTGNGRLDTTKQKAAYNTYASAFFRTFVGGDTTFLPILTVKDIIPPVSSLTDTNHIYMSYHPGRTDRVDVNRVDTTTNETMNTLGGAVTQGTVLSSGICGGGFTVPSCGVGAAAHEPHKGTSTTRGLSQMNILWNDTTAWYQNDVPAADEDFRFAESFQFRVALKYDECVTNQKLDFTVQLIDSAGNIASETVHDHSYALFYPPGGPSSTLVPKVLFNTVRISLSEFAGVDMATIRKVKFIFNKKDTGSVLFSDLALVNTHCGRFQSSIGYTIGTGNNVSFADTINSNTADTVTWLWNFGDPSSGTADTSSAHNPSHHFSSAGTYTVCAYIMDKRRSGWICYDTVCKVVTITPPVAVIEEVEQLITVNPNPAKDLLNIYGAEKTDVLYIYNVYGQLVFSANIEQPTIYLPPTMASGVYYTIIATKKNRIFNKIVVNR